MTKKRGRPAFRPTTEQKRTVAIAAGAGMSHEEIALGMGIHRDTLAKYFDRELSVGAHQKRLEIVKAMHAAAKKGSVSAARAYMQLSPKVAAPPEDADRPPAPTHEKAKALEPLGKKAQAQVDAAEAHRGTEWDGLLSPVSPLQ